MRHALVMLALAIRRASTLLPPAAPALRTARFATDASRALEQRFDAALKDDCGVRANDTVVAALSNLAEVCDHAADRYQRDVGTMNVTMPVVFFILYLIVLNNRFVGGFIRGYSFIRDCA